MAHRDRPALLLQLQRLRSLVGNSLAGFGRVAAFAELLQAGDRKAQAAAGSGWQWVVLGGAQEGVKRVNGGSQGGILHG